jgi:oligogalacturonide lyase
MKPLLFFLSCLVAAAAYGQQIPVLTTGGQMPDRWIDKATGHEIVRLSRRPGANRSFYFHNNPFLRTPDGKGWEMVYTGAVNGRPQLFTVDLQTLKSTQVTDFSHRLSGEMLGRKTRSAYFQTGDSVFAVSVDTHKQRLVYVFPPSFHGHIASVNCDETLMAGVWSSPEEREILKKHPEKSGFFTRIYDAHIPHVLFTVDLRTRQLHKIDSEDTWLNHEQFSPTDPDLLLYAHEGPWDKVDRSWLINVKTHAKKLLHKRSVKGEINGHEWWSPDGKMVWYDLQIPRSVTFYIGGTNVRTNKETRYALTRNEWSIHFNQSPDEKLFCGDGGDPTQVARAQDGMWIYLFTPEKDSLKADKLVDMHAQRYRALEPNVHFSPDGKWVIFRANFEGTDEIYAVRIRKTGAAS